MATRRGLDRKEPVVVDPYAAAIVVLGLATALTQVTAELLKLVRAKRVAAKRRPTQAEIDDAEQSLREAARTCLTLRPDFARVYTALDKAAKVGLGPEKTHHVHDLLDKAQSAMGKPLVRPDKRTPTFRKPAPKAAKAAKAREPVRGKTAVQPKQREGS
jgi:hypothetical protein